LGAKLVIFCFQSKKKHYWSWKNNKVSSGFGKIAYFCGMIQNEELFKAIISHSKEYGKNKK